MDSNEELQQQQQQKEKKEKRKHPESCWFLIAGDEGECFCHQVR